MLSNKQKETATKIRNACNQLVYLWKRAYAKSVDDNKKPPKPITIPQIANKAGVAPKTIYTNEEYKEISLTAIAKTTIFEIEDGKGNLELEFLKDKETYSKEEVEQLLRQLKSKYESNFNAMVKELSDKNKKESLYTTQIKDLNDRLDVFLIRISELESENSKLKGQNKILIQNSI